MASPTTGTQPRQIYLKFTPNGTVTTIPANSQSDPLLFKPDELVQFVSDSDVAVYIKFNSNKFDPNVFLPGKTVKYIGPNDPKNPVMHDCGYVEVVDGVPTSYGWVPDNVTAGTEPYKPRIDGPYGSYGVFGE